MSEREPPPLPPGALIPFDSTTGPKAAQIMLVGEAFGKDEEKVGLPFIGYSGRELTSMLAQAGIARSSCLLTNVFPFRPPDNNMEHLCGPKSLVGKDYPLAPLKMGNYILPQYLPTLDRLKAEVDACRPNLVIALGGTAQWALTGTSSITRHRGVVSESSLCPGTKVLPTFHPASVLRNWAQRPIVVADFIKAKREAAFPDLRRVSRRLLLDATLDELEAWWEEVKHSPSTDLACDIETRSGQITMISFANSPYDGVVVSFIRPQDKWQGEAGVSFWSSLGEELAAWRFVRKVLRSPCRKVFQNGLYDLQYLCRMGFRVENCLDDTMLLHHSIYPELPKSLGFLGGIYTNEVAWKNLRVKAEEKKD